MAVNHSANSSLLQSISRVRESIGPLGPPTGPCVFRPAARGPNRRPRAGPKGPVPKVQNTSLDSDSSNYRYLETQKAQLQPPPEPNTVRNRRYLLKTDAESTSTLHFAAAMLGLSQFGAVARPTLRELEVRP
jgi:hypothetical protein